MSPTSTSGPRSGLIYIALATLNVGGVLAAVLLCHTLVGRYRESVDISRVWAARAAAVSELSSKSTAANAPGNDVFENHDVPGERANLRRMVTQYEALHRAARADLDGMPAAERAQLVPQLEAARGSFQSMVREAEAIFAAFERNNPEEAGRHMATMDRANAEVSERLTELRGREAVMLHGIFAGERARAEGLGRFAWGLAGVVALLVGVVLYYGRVMNRAMAAAQRLIHRRNDDMKRLLDNAAQGFATMDLKGELSSERSAAFDRLLATRPEHRTLPEALRDHAPDLAAWMEMGLESARDGFLPLDISLDQLPKRVRVGERHLALEYRPIGETSVLCVVSDITSDVARETAEAEQREAMEVFGRILKDREGVVEFLAEAGEIVRGLTAPERPSLPEERRALHTLKGNAALFGLRALSSHCHALETASQEREGALTDAERTELSTRWDRTVSQMRQMLGEERGRMITVDEREHADIIDAVLAGEPARSVARRIAAWRMEAAEHRLERIATQAQRLSQTLGKPRVDVQVVPNGVRLAPDHWTRFFTELVHVVRNAVDHGIEPAEERVALGKDAQGTLTVSTTTENGRLRVVIADDGRGINWDRVREKADDLGIPAKTHQDLVAALFVDGMSTRDAVSETSGRGVGLAAVAEALHDLGGRVDVSTEPQRGTQFCFSMPCPDVGASIPCLDPSAPQA